MIFLLILRAEIALTRIKRSQDSKHVFCWVGQPLRSENESDGKMDLLRKRYFFGAGLRRVSELMIEITTGSSNFAMPWSPPPARPPANVPKVETP